MKKKTTKYILLVVGAIISVVFYLCLIGIETEKFNTKIRDRVLQVNNNLDFKLKKIKLTLDPINFKINAKTIGTKIVYQKKILELEYIKTQISLSSFFKNKIVSSNLEISSKSILLKDLVTVIRSSSNNQELFFFENLIKKGYIIFDIKLDFDENGKIKDNYEINGLLKDGQVNYSRNYNLKKINFIFNVRNKVFNFHDIKFKISKINFFF